MKLLTVILNWRTPEMSLDSAAAALREMEGMEGAVLLVDNDSGDGSEAAMRAGVLERGWPESRVRVVQAGRNGGYGAGNNAGIRAGLPDGTVPDLIYILNSDAFPNPGGIRALVDYLARHPRVAFAGSLLQGQEGELQTSAFRFFSVASEFEMGACLGPITRLMPHRVVPMDPDTPTGPVDWVTGASLMMRRAALDEIGLFDEGFFLYFEETDLCLRARRAGWETHLVRESSVTHLGSVSTGMGGWSRVPGYWFDSRWRYFAKNHGRATALAATAARIGGGLLHRLRMAATGKKPHDPPWFLWHLLRHDVAVLRVRPQDGGPPRP